jgi:hypothetical protein
VRIARYGCDSIDTKIERLGREAGLYKEWHDEATKTAVHMKTDPPPFCYGAQRGYIVYYAMWKVWCGTCNLLKIVGEHPIRIWRCAESYVYT